MGLGVRKKRRGWGWGCGWAGCRKVHQSMCRFWKCEAVRAAGPQLRWVRCADLASPFFMRLMMSYSQPVPSRQGVHCRAGRAGAGGDHV